MIVAAKQIDIEIPKSKTPRSKGVHISSIIRAIAIERGILRLEDYESLEDLSLSDSREILDPVAKLRICMGLAWEEWYIPQIKGVKDHPGEVVFDDIFLNHDAEEVTVIFTLGKGAFGVKIHEVKFTYKSIRTVGLDLKTQWMWVTQLKSYCKAKKTLQGVMHVLFCCGDYVFPIKPQLWVFDVTFTQEELDENWALMRDYRNYMVSIGRAQ